MFRLLLPPSSSTTARLARWDQAKESEKSEQEKKNVYLFDVGIRQIILPLIWRAAINRRFKYYTCLYRGSLDSAQMREPSELASADDSPLCFGHISSHFGFFIAGVFSSHRHCTFVAERPELDWRGELSWAHSSELSLFFPCLNVQLLSDIQRARQHYAWNSWVHSR